MESLQQKLRNALPGTISPLKSPGPIVLIDEAEPVLFWGKFTGALENAQSIVLLDPAWPDKWKSEYTRLAKKSLPGKSQYILVPTSGTTGKPRFCVHTCETLSVAARAYAQHFGSKGIIHSINVLPQHHVGGFMPVWRSAFSGGKSCFARYTDDPASLDLPFPLSHAAISLVPTQLKRNLQSSIMVEGLRQLGLILVGGAACSAPLLEECRRAGLNLAPCYGSTETAAMVSVLDPIAFLSGGNSVGKPLPGMSIGTNQDGLVEIHSESIQLGYLPDTGNFSRNPMLTSDLGMLHDDDELQIIGRADRVIITGGKKVIPEQVEEVAMESGWIKDAWCCGQADPDWGSRVELTVVPEKAAVDPIPLLKAYLIDKLPAYAIPKKYHLAGSISRNRMGKRIH